MASTQLLTILTGVLAVIALGIYLFGIPSEWKRELERQALKAMGENKMSYVAKDQVNRIPDSDQKNIQDVKGGVGNVVGGVTNNPLGEATGEAADSLTSPLTGR
ncbi:uncharacterized protein EI97DRAFT_367724 [Westerdykella ornata]|uniref:Uncharacterized protein n=1 Tax=Westerdykella ornata TaxID=318751 RepID=A0A6A6JYD7_WESOR|nr:uncharacterized protein EI97DRAFT_367724 [Westerdykella ornata]KAF2281205.1 hypothetical protein EI97DRAFT_367724 [Westerdykella ornata]